MVKMLCTQLWILDTSTARLLLDRGANIHAERGILEAAVTSRCTAMIELVSHEIDAARKGHELDPSLLACVDAINLPVACMEDPIEYRANPVVTTRNAEAPIHLLRRTDQ